MTNPTPTADDAGAENKIKAWMHDVLNERDAKAAADKEAADKKAAEDAEKARTRGPGGFLDALFGKLS